MCVLCCRPGNAEEEGVPQLGEGGEVDEPGIGIGGVEGYHHGFHDPPQIVAKALLCFGEDHVSIVQLRVHYYRKKERYLELTRVQAKKNGYLLRWMRKFSFLLASCFLPCIRQEQIQDFHVVRIIGDTMY